MQYKVMTFNIQHGIDHLRRMARDAAMPKIDLTNLTPEQMEAFKNRKPPKEDPSYIDLDKVGKGIASQAPIFCALNEVRNDSNAECYTNQAKEIAAAADMPYYYFAEAIYLGGQGPYGNAMVSSWPIVSAETIKIPDPVVKDENAYYETRCLLKAKLQSPEGKILTVMITHMGLAKQEARNAVQTILDNLDPTEPTVLMGDFNLEPDSDILAPIFANFKSCMEILPEGICTFPSDAPDIKIDYIFVSGPIDFVSAEIPDMVISDHLPHTAVVEF